MKSEMPRWQERLFIWLAGRAEDATEYFRIPSDRVVEVGTQGSEQWGQTLMRGRNPRNARARRV